MDFLIQSVFFIFVRNNTPMTTIIINDRKTGAKKMIEYLKTQKYATIVEERVPSASLLKSMEEAKSGQANEYKSTKELFSKLRKRTNV